MQQEKAVTVAIKRNSRPLLAVLCTLNRKGVLSFITTLMYVDGILCLEKALA